MGNTGRVETFSDGVFAVAITLLVLQLAVPEVGEGKLAHALADQWPLLASYGASFLTVGVTWLNHRRIFSYLGRIDRPLEFLNLVLLLFIVLIPYPTALLGHYLQVGHDAQIAATALGAVMTAMAAAFTAMWTYATGHPAVLRDGVDPAAAKKTRWRYGLGLLMYAASIGLAWLSPLLVLVLYAVSAVFYSFDQLTVPGARERPED